MDQVDYYARCEQEFACEHLRSSIALKITATGRQRYLIQCRDCGQEVRPLKKATLSKTEMARAIPYDKELRDRNRERFYARLRELREESLSREQDEWFAWYSEYLDSPEWRSRRKRVLERARGQCEGCGLRPATQVHHLHYRRAGREMLFDLVAVCEECHGDIHSDEPRRQD